MSWIWAFAFLLCLTGVFALLSPPKPDEQAEGTQVIAIMLLAAGLGILLLLYYIGPIMTYLGLQGTAPAS